MCCSQTEVYDEYSKGDWVDLCIVESIYMNAYLPAFPLLQIGYDVLYKAVMNHFSPILTQKIAGPLSSRTLDIPYHGSATLTEKKRGKCMDKLRKDKLFKNAMNHNFSTTKDRYSTTAITRMRKETHESIGQNFSYAAEMEEIVESDVKNPLIQSLDAFQSFTGEERGDSTNLSQYYSIYVYKNPFLSGIFSLFPNRSLLFPDSDLVIPKPAHNNPPLPHFPEDGDAPVDYIERALSLHKAGKFTLDNYPHSNRFLREIKDLNLAKERAGVNDHIVTNFSTFSEANTRTSKKLEDWYQKIVELLPNDRGLSVREVDSAMGILTNARMGSIRGSLPGEWSMLYGSLSLVHAHASSIKNNVFLIRSKNVFQLENTYTFSEYLHRNAQVLKSLMTCLGPHWEMLLCDLLWEGNDDKRAAFTNLLLILGKLRDMDKSDYGVIAMVVKLEGVWKKMFSNILDILGRLSERCENLCRNLVGCCDALVNSPILSAEYGGKLLNDWDSQSKLDLNKRTELGEYFAALNLVHGLFSPFLVAMTFPSQRSLVNAEFGALIFILYFFCLFGMHFIFFSNYSKYDIFYMPLQFVFCFSFFKYSAN